MTSRSSHDGGFSAAASSVGNGQTVSMMLKQGATTMRAFGFQMGDRADLLAGVKHIDIAAEPALNTYNGRTNVEVKLLDVKW